MGCKGGINMNRCVDLTRHYKSCQAREVAATEGIKKRDITHDMRKRVKG